MSVVASIVVAGVGVGGVLRGVTSRVSKNQVQARDQKQAMGRNKRRQGSEGPRDHGVSVL